MGSALHVLGVASFVLAVAVLGYGFHRFNTPLGVPYDKAKFSLVSAMGCASYSVGFAAFRVWPLSAMFAVAAAAWLAGWWHNGGGGGTRRRLRSLRERFAGRRRTAPVYA